MSNEDQRHPSFLKRMKEKVRRMKQDTLALYYAYGNPGTPWSAKILIWLTIGYLLSPIDLIPDFIPVLGLLDDLIIVPLLIVLSIKLIPKEVWEESLQRAELEPLILKKSRIFAGLVISIWLLVIACISYCLLPNACYDRTVILPDVRGYGKSVCYDPTNYTWDNYASDINDLLNYLQIPDAVIGGAGIGTTISLRLRLLIPNE